MSSPEIDIAEVLDAAHESGAPTELPSRRGLIAGAALVALHGLRREVAHTSDSDDLDTVPLYAEVQRLIAAVQAGERTSTDYERIVDLLAHTRQTLRVSYQEWEDCVPVHLIG